MIKWRRFCRILKRLNVINVNSEYYVKRVNFLFCFRFILQERFVHELWLEIFRRQKNLNSDVEIRYPTFSWLPWCLCVFLMIKFLSSDKVYVSVNKFGVHSRHVIRFFLLHYVVFCLTNVNINTLQAYFYGIWKVSFSQESTFWCLYVYLIPYIHQRPKPGGSKWRLSFIHYHCVSCHSISVFLRNIWLHYEYDWTYV